MNLNAVIIVRYGDGLDDMIEVPYEYHETFIDLGLYLKKSVNRKTSSIGKGVKVQSIVVDGVYLPVTTIEDAHLVLKTISDQGLQSLPRFILAVKGEVSSIKEAIEMYHDAYYGTFANADELFLDVMKYDYPETNKDLYRFIDKEKLLEYHSRNILKLGNTYFYRRYLKSA